MYVSRHFGSYQQSKLSVPQRKGRNRAVKSSQLCWAGQYKKCVKYDFQFSSEYSGVLCLYFLIIYEGICKFVVHTLAVNMFPRFLFRRGIQVSCTSCTSCYTCTDKY